VVDREVVGPEWSARDREVRVGLGDARHAARLFDARLDARLCEVGRVREAHALAVEHPHAESALAARDDALDLPVLRVDRA